MQSTEGGAARERGFTLMEALVVLVLTGLVASILFQGLGQVFRLESRLGHELFASQKGEMYVQWFRGSVNGLLPDHADGANRFSGSEREFRGLSVSSPLSSSDALLPISWQMRFDADSGTTRLHFGTAQDGPVVLSWSGNSGRFAYLDGEGELHQSWPPLVGEWPPLPNAVFLESRDPDRSLVVVAVPRGTQSPLPRRRDLRD